MIALSTKWAPSPHYNVIKNRRIVAIVLHTAQCQEIARADDNVAAWFANPLSRVSAHYIVDADSITQCVSDVCVAWHASQVNDWTIGIELGGDAYQTRAQWHDAYSEAELAQAAALVATLCDSYDIPIVRTPIAQIPARGVGLFGHVDVTHAYGVANGHQDPGPSFDWPEFLERVRAA